MVESTDLRQRVNSIVWYHSIDLGDGVVTDGFSKTAIPTSQLPDFSGKTVLDIGAWDGYYSFLAERGGASRVVALDHYVWGVDFARRNPYWVDCSERGALPDHGLDTTEFWDPSLPGMTGFNVAREALGSQVEAVVGDFSTMDLSALGRFDIVLFLGVLYHLREPLAALERVRRVTGDVAVIESEALFVPGHETASLLEFTAGCYRGFDFSNWFTPTQEALIQLCLAAGFSHVEAIVGPPAPTPPPVPATGTSGLVALRRRLLRRPNSPRPEPPRPELPPTAHYRALLHAYP